MSFVWNFADFQIIVLAGCLVVDILCVLTLEASRSYLPQAALHLAAEHDCVDVATVLLQHGADVNLLSVRRLIFSLFQHFYAKHVTACGFVLFVWSGVCCYVLFVCVCFVCVVCRVGCGACVCVFHVVVFMLWLLLLLLVVEFLPSALPSLAPAGLPRPLCVHSPAASLRLASVRACSSARSLPRHSVDDGGYSM